MIKRTSFIASFQLVAHELEILDIIVDLDILLIDFIIF